MDGRRLPAVVGPVGCAMRWSSSHCRAGVEQHGPTQRGSRSSTNLTRPVDAFSLALIAVLDGGGLVDSCQQGPFEWLPSPRAVWACVTGCTTDVVIHRVRARRSQSLYLVVMHRRWLLTVAVMSMAVVACSGSASEKPTVLPAVPTASGTVATTATPTASSSPVVVPSEAAPATPQGAAALVRFFYNEVNTALQDGSATRIRALSDGRCGTCADYAQTVEAAAKIKYFIIGPSFATSNIEAGRAVDGRTLVTVVGTLPRRRVSDRGVVTTSKADGPFQSTVAVERHDQHWLVLAIQHEKS